VEAQRSSPNNQQPQRSSQATGSAAIPEPVAEPVLGGNTEDNSEAEGRVREGRAWLATIPSFLAEEVPESILSKPPGVPAGLALVPGQKADPAEFAKEQYKHQVHVTQMWHREKQMKNKAEMRCSLCARSRFF
jgi:hypothetical protein